jgi:nucleoid DNA-binding protein
MNKSELIDAITDDAGITKSQAGSAIDSLVNNVEQALKRGEKVTVVGFGTFSSSERSARIGRNPQTGNSIRIPAKKVVKFSPGKSLKEAIQ